MAATLFTSEDHGRKTRKDSWFGRNEDESLYRAILGYCQSSAKDVRVAFYIACVSLFLTLLSSWAILTYSDYFRTKFWAVLFCFAMTLVELGSFLYIFVEIDHWLENNFASSAQRKIWRLLVLGVWIAVLLLCVLFVKFVQPPVGWLLGFVGLHVYGFLIVSLFGLPGYLSERYG